MGRKTPEELAQAHERRNYGQETQEPEQEQYAAEFDDSDNDTDDSFDDDFDAGDDRTSELEKELKQLRDQNAALQGRLTPSQQKYEQYKSLYENEYNARAQEQSKYAQEIQQLKEQLNTSKPDDFNLEDVMSEEELEMFDRDTLEAIKKISSAAASRNRPNIDEKLDRAFMQREQQSVEQYRNELLSSYNRPISELNQLAHNPEFRDWIEREENDDFEPLVNSFLKANSKSQIDKLAKSVERRIAKFKGGSDKSRSGSTDAKTSLDRANQRRPRKLTESQLADKLNEAKRLSRSSSRADREKAKSILDKLN